MTIIGIRPSEFKGDDGSIIKGKNFYMTYALEKGEGQGAERVYLTDAKLQEMGFTPSVGDNVQLFFNRWGKCSGMELI